MNRSVVQFLIGCILAAFTTGLVGGYALSAKPNDLEGVARIIDGDTVAIGGRIVRLLDMDAPEGAQTCQDARGNTYECGWLATKVLIGIVAGRELSCEGNKLDRYGRLLAICRAEGLDIGRAMVLKGWAWPYRRGTGRYDADAAIARSEQRGAWAGIWIDPFEWRRLNR